jgi:hypothetical protein
MRDKFPKMVRFVKKYQIGPDVAKPVIATGEIGAVCDSEHAIPQVLIVGAIALQIPPRGKIKPTFRTPPVRS